MGWRVDWAWAGHVPTNAAGEVLGRRRVATRFHRTVPTQDVYSVEDV